MSRPILLGINIDHVATLRQARGKRRVLMVLRCI